MFTLQSTIGALFAAILCMGPAFGQTPRAAATGAPLPVRGLHVRLLTPPEVDTAADFIRDVLPKEGVNVLVLAFSAEGYRFARRPELSGPNALSREDVKKVADACRRAGVRLIPAVNMLGHQSRREINGPLLRAYPEFDETPGKYPNNTGIYCRSLCPLHPGVYPVLFDIIDELTEACESDAFHAGMDEVLILGDDDCPRCRGRKKADLFAHAVNTLHGHLAKSNRTLWIWGDRLLDATKLGLGAKEASQNGTAPAIHLISKDVVICDWHYGRAMPTAVQFAIEGFPVVSSPWRNAEVALGQLELIRHVRKNATKALASRMQGVLHTTWTSMGEFMEAYYGRETRREARESASCFKRLFAELRRGGMR